MKVYLVKVKEVYESHRYVEASDEREALTLAKNAECTHLQYNSTLDKDKWDVQEIQTGGVLS